MSCSAAQAGSGVRALAELSLEDLMSVEVVSASRGRDTLGDVAAPVFVITRDDLLRTGVRSLLEALRLAPGVDVARLSGSHWAVGVRGDTGRFANKLQVLLDGRSLYSPLFSGVFWEAERVPIADIERIEVIRGPAGAVWGGNAVNGVINIITREAQQTAGTLVEADAGSEGAAVLHARHGHTDGLDSGWRLMAQVDGSGESHDESGSAAHDGSRVSLVGARLDHRLDASTRLSVQTQALHSVTSDTRIRVQPQAPYLVPAVTRQLIDRYSLLGVWQQTLVSGDEFRARGLLYHEQGDEQAFIRMRASRVELEGELRQTLDNHQITWGGGVRFYWDRAVSMGLGQFDPQKQSMHNTHLFAQDRWQPENVPVTVQTGLRLDRHYFAGTQAQPSLAVSWKPAQDTLLWTSVARAVREPSRGEADAQLPVAVVAPSVSTGGLPVLLGYASERATVVESVVARQIGWRGRLGEQVSADLTLFRHDYDPLSFIGAQADNPSVVMGPVPYVQASMARVPGRARVSGLELATDWRPIPGVRQQLSWTWLTSTLEPASPTDTSTLQAMPRQLLSLRLSYDPSPLWSVDVWLRHVAAREGGGGVSVSTPARTTLDLSTRRVLSQTTTLTLRAYNLGARRQIEIRPDIGYSVPVAIDHGVSARVEVNF